MEEEKIEKYNKWNEKKIGINVKKRTLLFKEGEIWWCSIGLNIGEEVFGKGEEFRRPVVILKKLTNNTCIVLPITTKLRQGSWYHHISIQNMDKWIMMHQIRFISANRLYARDATLTTSEFFKLKKSVATLLGLL